MAETVNTAQRQQEKPKGLVSSLMGLPLKLVGLIFTSLLLSLIFEWVGLAFFWREAGWHHAQETFQTELGWLSENFQRSLLSADPGSQAAQLLSQSYDWLFVKSGFEAFSQNASAVAGTTAAASWPAQLYLMVEDYALASVYVTMTFFLRLIVLVLSIPLFVMAGTVGIVDGLTRRDLRKFGAGRESSFIYHHAKRLLIPLLTLPWLVYLAIPITTNPIFVLIPCALAFGIAITVTTATFKKYL